MDLTPNAEQQALVAATSAWCREEMPLEAARARPPGMWRQLEAMGWLGMTAPDEAGGLGLDHASEALVYAELGRFLAPVGMLSTAVAARWGGPGGKCALALVDRGIEGGAARVFDPEGAAHALEVVDHVAAIAPLPADLGGEPGLDLSAPLAHFVPAPRFETIPDRRAALHLQLLAAAFAVGCGDAARDMAASYALLREQFERPIGWFQALKHLCADMAVRSAVARSQLYFAACALDAQDPEAEFHIAAAKHLADQAALENARGNIQVHGGIGMTDEADPHLCLKRAHLLSFVAPVRREILLGEAA
jgi:alkylation response protein AidB-like acyl-CoA dehydrogenase